MRQRVGIVVCVVFIVGESDDAGTFGISSSQGTREGRRWRAVLGSGACAGKVKERHGVEGPVGVMKVVLKV